MTRRRRMSIVVVAVVFIIVNLIVFVPHHVDAQGTTTTLCQIADTGLVQTLDADLQFFSWSLPARPDAVVITVCDGAAGAYCVSVAPGMSFTWYTSGDDYTYGIRVDLLSSSQIIVRYPLYTKSIAYIYGFGWVHAGSAYIRIVAYQACEVVSTPQSTATPNATIPALVTAVATLSTPPAASPTPTATVDATYLPMILSSGNAWGMRREVDYGNASIVLSLVVLAGIDAMALIRRVLLQ